MNLTSAAAKVQPMSKAGIAFFSSLCVTTFGLGCWQTQRYFEKIESVEKRINELSKDGQHLEPNATYTGSGTSISRGYRPIIVQGKYMHEHEILIGPRGPPPGVLSSSGPNSGRSSGGMSSSPQGFYVLTPLVRHNKMGTVLVNRGWVPMQYVQQNAHWDKPTGKVDVIGVESKTEQPTFLSPQHSMKEPKKLLWIDRASIEVKTNTKGMSPLLLTETTPMNSIRNDNVPITFPVKPSIETVGEFKVLPLTHAGYAVTWFGLSGAGIFMTRKLITRGRA
mmetsp:Transcript_29482/g.33880  ORF Transcript_29482/g.33880 Transcript_29482/m.33880 type:complete len:279 (+) Transcript_29482:68-904(+)